MAVLDSGVLERFLPIVAIGLVLFLAGLWLRRRPAVLTRRLRGRQIQDPYSNRGSGPLILAFTSPDCVPCRTAQRPALEEVSRRLRGGVQVREIDIIQDPQTAREFGIFSVPSTVLIDAGGDVIALNIGLAPAEKLLNQLGLNGGNSLLPQNSSE